MAAFYTCSSKVGVNTTELGPLVRLKLAFLETPAILKKTATASYRLAEIKGLAASMPNQGIFGSLSA